MANPKWQLAGDYFEACSCDHVCPCVTTNLAGGPTKGECNFAMVFQVQRGQFDNVNLDGLSFAFLGNAPDALGNGNWAVGVIIDDRATPEQEQAIATIATGQAGGPPAILTSVVGTFLGVEARPILIQKNGMKRSVFIPNVLKQTCQGVPSAADPDKPLCIDNTLHLANTRLALAQATDSHMHAFGIHWDDTSGKNNGFFAPFNWQAN